MNMSRGTLTSVLDSVEFLRRKQKKRLSVRRRRKGIRRGESGGFSTYVDSLLSIHFPREQKIRTFRLSAGIIHDAKLHGLQISTPSAVLLWLCIPPHTSRSLTCIQSSSACSVLASQKTQDFSFLPTVSKNLQFLKISFMSLSASSLFWRRSFCY